MSYAPLSAAELGRFLRGQSLPSRFAPPPETKGKGRETPIRVPNDQLAAAPLEDTLQVPVVTPPAIRDVLGLPQLPQQAPQAPATGGPVSELVSTAEARVTQPSVTYRTVQLAIRAAMWLPLALGNLLGAAVLRAKAWLSGMLQLQTVAPRELAPAIPMDGGQGTTLGRALQVHEAPAAEIAEKSLSNTEDFENIDATPPLVQNEESSTTEPREAASSLQNLLMPRSDEVYLRRHRTSGMLDRLPPEILFGKILLEIAESKNAKMNLQALYAAAPSLFYQEFGDFIQTMVTGNEENASSGLSGEDYEGRQANAYQARLLDRLSILVGRRGGDGDISFPDNQNEKLKLAFAHQKTAVSLIDDRTYYIPRGVVVEDRIPPELVAFVALEKLEIQGKMFREIFDISILNALPYLKSLAVRGELMGEKGLLPKGLDSLVRLNSLELKSLELDFTKFSLTKTPDLKVFTSLKSLTLAYCGLSVLPDYLGTLTHLEALDLSGNKLTEVDQKTSHLDQVANLKDLRKLNISRNLFDDWPEFLDGCLSLEALNLAGAFKEGGRLTLGNGALERLVNLNRLKKIDISENNLGALPDVLKDLPMLTAIRGIRNGATVIPQWLLNMKQLKVLDLTANNLNFGSADFSRLHQLENILLRGCASNYDRTIVGLARTFAAMDALKIAAVSTNSSLLPEFTKIDAESFATVVSSDGNHVTVFGSDMLTKSMPGPLNFPHVLRNDEAHLYRREAKDKDGAGKLCGFDFW